MVEGIKPKPSGGGCFFTFILSLCCEAYWRGVNVWCFLPQVSIRKTKTEEVGSEKKIVEQKNDNAASKMAIKSKKS
jgi:hypothetical protein